MVSLPRDTDELADVTFLRHEACPDCGSSDALAVYDDGHTYCFYAKLIQTLTNLTLI